MCLAIMGTVCAHGVDVQERVVDGRQEVVSSFDMSYGWLKAQAALTIDQRLDRSLSVPGVLGILRGTTGTPRISTIAAAGPFQGAIVTDYPFTIAGGFGSALTKYPVGTVVSLRVLGGTIGDQTSVVSNSPKVSAGKEYYVWVRDQGVIAGGNTSSVIVVSTPYSVHEIRDGVVYGVGYSEPLATFEQHFIGQLPPKT
jgi:hypothetical protein